MKKIWLIMVLSTQLSYGQDHSIDSLKVLLKHETNTIQKLELLNQLTDAASKFDLKTATDFARQGVTLAREAKSKTWEPKFLEMQGRMHANQLELDSAWVCFEKALRGYVAIDDKKGQATTYFKIGWVHKKRGDLEAALQVDLKALKLMESIQNKPGIAGATNRISEDLARQERLSEALAYATKNIAFCKENNLQQEQIFAFVAAGDASIHLGKAQDAYFYFDNAIQLAKRLNSDNMLLSDLNNNVGNALKRLERYQEALTHYQTALRLAQEVNYQNAIYTVIANLGEINLLLRNYPEALKYQLETVRLQEQSGDFSNLAENYGHVSTIYEKLGNYPLALHYQKKKMEVREKIVKTESDRAMSEMLTKYDSEKKELTISQQNRQLSQQRLVQWLSIGMAVLLLGALFLGYRSFRIRTKSNRRLAVKNAENELLLKEIHHRVKNNLELVKSLIALQSAHLEDSETKDAMIASQNRVQSMGIIHQKLYQGTNLGSIEMKDYFINLGEGILDTFNADDKVKIECVMDDLELDIDTAVPIGLIVNELLTNSLKYAFPQNAQGEIQISLAKTGPQELTLHVIDNGVGKAGAIVKGTGFGTQLIQLLTRQLNGIMEELPHEGTSTVFHFKTQAA